MMTSESRMGSFCGTRHIGLLYDSALKRFLISPHSLPHPQSYHPLLPPPRTCSPHGYLTALSPQHWSTRSSGLPTYSSSWTPCLWNKFHMSKNGTEDGKRTRTWTFLEELTNAWERHKSRETVQYITYTQRGCRKTSGTKHRVEHPTWWDKSQGSQLRGSNPWKEASQPESPALRDTWYLTGWRAWRISLERLSCPSPPCSTWGITLTLTPMVSHQHYSNTSLTLVLPPWVHPLSAHCAAPAHCLILLKVQSWLYSFFARKLSAAICSLLA